MCLCLGTRGHTHSPTPHTPRRPSWRPVWRFPRAARTRRCRALPWGRCREPFSTRHLGLSQVATARGREGETPGPGEAPGVGKQRVPPAGAEHPARGPGAGAAGPCPGPRGPGHPLSTGHPSQACRTAGRPTGSESGPMDAEHGPHSGSRSSAGDRPGWGSVAVGGAAAKGTGFASPRRSLWGRQGLSLSPIQVCAALRAPRGRSPACHGHGQRAGPGAAGSR